MSDRYEKTSSAFSRGPDLARIWASHLEGILSLPGRRESLELYRRVDWSNNESTVRDDGSIILGARTASGLDAAGHHMLDARLSTDPRPSRDQAQAVRQAMDEFITVYLQKVNPPGRARTAGSRAFDSGLQDAVVIPKLLKDARMEGMYPHIPGMDGRQPYLQGATQELTTRLGKHLGMQPGELEDLLVKTPPAERFEKLADVLIKKDPLQRRLPDGSPRTPPEDHVARLNDALREELDLSFETCGMPSLQRGDGARASGQKYGEFAATRVLKLCRQARNTIDTVEPGYQQVASLMSAVQADLAQGRTSVAQGRKSGAIVLQLKMNADYWNGALHTSGLPEGTLGSAGPDRSLTFDQEKVLDVLANADPTEPPSPELRDAVDVVATEAARLCNPVAPGTVPNDLAGQAFEDRLHRDFVGRQQDQLFTVLGFPEDQPAGNAPTATATAQVVATLTEAAARKQGLEPHDVTARLLTTAPHERIEAAAALSLGEPGAVADRGAWSEATKSLAANITATLEKAAEADHDGKTKLHVWNRATAGERLSHQLTVAIDKAGQPLGQASASGDEALMKSLAAATSGQTPPGGDRAGGADATARRGHQPDNGKSGQRSTGRG